MGDPGGTSLNCMGSGGMGVCGLSGGEDAALDAPSSMSRSDAASSSSQDSATPFLHLAKISPCKKYA